jgi:hypothetical protein
MTLQDKRTSMHALVASWRESDKTQIEFARENGLTVSKFRYWVHKSRNISDSNLPSSGFIRISDNNLQLNETGNTIRLHYPNGVSLSLPAGTSLSVIKNLIDY